MNDPKRLQELISSNALIGAFLGESAPAPAPAQQSIHSESAADTVAVAVPGEGGATGAGAGAVSSKQLEEEAALSVILNSIACSRDIEALMDGIASDLNSFIQHCTNTSAGTSVSASASASTSTSTSNTSGNDGDLNSNHDSNAKNIDEAQMDTANDTGTDTNTNTDTKQSLPPSSSLLIPFVCRISRIKTLLYNEDIPSNNANNENKNNNTNQAQPSFIQQFLPMINYSLSNDNDTQSSTMDYSSNDNIYTSSSSPHQYNQLSATENAKLVLHFIYTNHNNNSNSSNNNKLIIPTLLQYIHILPFEIRKDVSSIFNCLLVNSDYNVRMEFMFYVQEYFHLIMDFIVYGHFVNISTSTSTSTRSTSDNSSDSGIDMTGKKQRNNSGECSGSDNDDPNIKDQSPNVDENVPITKTIKTPDVALHCGSMLRSIIRHPILYAQLVNDESNVEKYIFPFLDSLVNQQNFEIASDALETLRLILHPMDMDIVLPFDDSDGDEQGGVSSSSRSLSNGTACALMSNHTHNDHDAITSQLLNTKDTAEMEIAMEKLSSSFLEKNYTSIFTQRFNPKLLSSDHANYITRRVSLQLLSSILLTRSNYNIMIKYVSSKENLRTIMMLLRDSSAHITLEAFNVFKIFVANPNKPPQVMRILADNKIKLIKYLSGLHKDREEFDEQLRDEKILVISTLEQLE